MRTNAARKHLASRSRRNSASSSNTSGILNKSTDKEVALNILAQLDESEKQQRQNAYRFYSESMQVSLGYPDTDKGCMLCFKEKLKFASQATMYRYIQVGKLENRLKLQIGSQAQTVMLELAKFEEQFHKIIWEKINKPVPTKDDFNSAVRELLMETKIAHETWLDDNQPSDDTNLSPVKEIELGDIKQHSNEVLLKAILSCLSSLNDETCLTKVQQEVLSKLGVVLDDGGLTQ